MDMGFLDWLFGLWTRKAAPTEDTVDDVADRLDRCGDRFRNAGDAESEQAARAAADAARRSGGLVQALRIEREFLAAHGLSDQPVPSSLKPLVGRAKDPSGSRFVRFGNSVRVGGSRGWRNNNPGYIRCGNRATTYGAIGCDGEYAIFPDAQTGSQALLNCLRDQYPSHTLKEALREQLPPEEVGKDAADEIQRKTGLDPDQNVGQLSEEQLREIAEAIQGGGCWVPGDTYESGGLAPDWVDSMWNESDAAEVSAVDTSAETSSTDDS
jgi:hypothetical protein